MAARTGMKRSGPGAKVCKRVKALAAKTAGAMFGGTPSAAVIASLGGIGRVDSDTLEVVNYVYSFAGVRHVTKGQIMALSFDKCMAGGFDIEGPGDAESPGAVTVGDSSGSGFIVNARGDVLTNRHVVDGCRSIRLQQGKAYFPAKLLHARAEIDLAVVHAEGLPSVSAIFSQVAEPMRGERVVAAGYPLQNILSRQVNITSGIVSATAGPGENRTMMQITVPLQPGNSGGPVLDAYGLVSGVSVAKLSHLATLQRAGTIPENVNFAVKGAVARSFLHAHDIPFRTAPPEREATNIRIGDEAQRYTLFIECQR